MEGREQEGKRGEGEEEEEYRGRQRKRRRGGGEAEEAEEEEDRGEVVEEETKAKVARSCWGDDLEVLGEEEWEQRGLMEEGWWLVMGGVASKNIP